MVIGIVVNVMNAENEKMLKLEEQQSGEPTIEDVYAKLERIDRLLETMQVPLPQQPPREPADK